MNTLQEEVSHWADSIFGFSISSQILHLWEELEEAFSATVQAYPDPNVTDKIREEIADAGLILMHLASTYGYRLPEPSMGFSAILREKFEKCKQRKWAPRADGEVRHA